MMIDKLAYASPWRYKSVSLKTSLAVGSLIICVGVRSFLVSGLVLAIMSCLAVTYSRATLRRYGKMMLWPFTFLLLGTIAILVDLADGPIGIWNIRIGDSYLVITMYSLVYSLRLIAVSLASVSCLYFLVLTTPVLDLMGLLRRLHCPWLVIELMMLIYRFIFVLLDSALSITRAQNCRLGNRDMKTSITSMGNMLAALLVQAIGKASVLFDAMEARCYDGRIRVLSENVPAAKGEKALVFVYLVLLLSAAVFCSRRGGL